MYEKERAEIRLLSNIADAERCEQVEAKLAAVREILLPWLDSYLEEIDRGAAIGIDILSGEAKRLREALE